MRTTILTWALLLLASLGSASPTKTVVHSATFTYGPIQSNNCSPITAWNGVPNAYPEDMGIVCFNFYPNPYSGIDVPQQLGFPNGGSLQDCPGFTWGAKTFTSGDGTSSGDTFTEPGTTSCPGYNVTLNVEASFVVNITTSCSQHVCKTYTTYTLTGGTGSVEVVLEKK